MLKKLTVLLFMLFCPAILTAQTNLFRTAESVYFSRVSMKLGTTWAFDGTADDHYDLAFRIPVHSRFHVMLGAGYRNASPQTIATSLGLQADLWRSNQARVKFEIDHTYLYRASHTFFDDRVNKTSIGIGGEYIIWDGIGVGAEYLPAGFYHGTRHDNPQKGTPSPFGARELRLAVHCVF